MTTPMIHIIPMTTKVNIILNKSIISLNENLADKAEEGMNLALCIDSYVRIIKKGNIVRKSLNLKI